MARLSAQVFDEQLGAADVAMRLAANFEAALACLNALSQSSLGEPDAARLPGMLREGERDYRVAGTFLVTPDRRYNMLCGNIGFPAEQRRLMIPIAWNDPGWVVAQEKPLLVPNTDRHRQFRQFLKSSRMGSSIYAPVHGEVDGRIVLIGQMVAAAQARETYDDTDLARLCRIARLAGQAHRLHDGESWLAVDYPAPDAWRAEVHALFEANAAESSKG